ncbi:LOW QUALITY PROTEIN: cyclic nucleotide-binding domain-containing protein 1-like [Sinocyclocheilus anshuiensis]|uniref:LOW QUALITY PROTEIN: cyclic nucleotide-binding domain-containing protein 1-like n=1 Tax=Sinocyclocheilus anshuiensis TaxID=1608454 RepID=UPI0007BAA99D|nr:PREDICTED: LOW QUALITY PROTEIN: cyclic nucleotide-binding domain-containing protein 1-like [Sinocyclocheilus anshuiensis]
MKLYQEIFLRPQTTLPRIQLKTRIQSPVKLRVYESVQEVSRHQPHGKLAQESLMNHVIKALKKFPIERSQSEHHIIYKLLKGAQSLTSQLGSQELKQISTITTVETWERGQIIFGHNGFYLFLKGSVKPFNHETLKEDQTISTIAAGGSFGSCESVNAVDGGAIIQGVVTLETCEILKISRSGYKKLKKDILAEDHEVKVSLIQGCQLYRHWPKLSINHLVDSMQLRTFPANQVLVKEGKICPFVAFIGRGECNILQDVGSLTKPVDKKGCRIRFVMVGKLGPNKQSFGEVSILLNQPSPCTVITATEVHGGIIQPECLKGLDSVTTSLILKTAQPMCGKLSKEEVMKEFLTQERMKKWEHEKLRKILSDAMFYKGVHPGRGKLTFNRGPRGVTGKSKSSI